MVVAVATLVVAVLAGLVVDVAAVLALLQDAADAVDAAVVGHLTSVMVATQIRFLFLRSRASSFIPFITRARARFRAPIGSFDAATKSLASSHVFVAFPFISIQPNSQQASTSPFKPALLKYVVAFA